MNYNTIAYLFYFLITIFVILRVGHILFKSGRPFIINCLHGDVLLADAINRILLAGYYLVNAGYAVYALKIWQEIDSYRMMCEMLSLKIGLIILALGIMHIFNVFMLLLSDRRRTWREQNMKQQHTEQ